MTLRRLLSNFRPLLSGRVSSGSSSSQPHKLRSDARRGLIQLPGHFTSGNPHDLLGYANHFGWPLRASGISGP